MASIVLPPVTVMLAAPALGAPRVAPAGVLEDSVWMTWKMLPLQPLDACAPTPMMCSTGFFTGWLKSTLIVPRPLHAPVPGQEPSAVEIRSIGDVVATDGVNMADVAA